MALPVAPPYIFGAYVHAYVSKCNDEVKKRFEDLQKQRGITIPNDNTPLRTAQLELFMEAI